jgi:hypothetical protein
MVGVGVGGDGSTSWDFLDLIGILVARVFQLSTALNDRLTSDFKILTPQNTL